MAFIQGEKRQRQEYQGDGADDVGRLEAVKGEKVAGDAGQQRSPEKPGGPAIELLFGEETGYDKQASGDADQTEHYVYERESGQDHGGSPVFTRFFISGRSGLGRGFAASDERQQFCVDAVFESGAHAVRSAFVNLKRSVLDDLRGAQARGNDGDDLVVVAVQD